jgi:hypothetical protein
MKRMIGRTTTGHGSRFPTARPATRPRAAGVLPADAGELADTGVGPTPSGVLTGGDVDADCMRAWDAGDEAVGGSTAMPDQDVVDEIGRALGVEQEPDAEVWTSREILRERDRHRWDQEA